MLYLVARTSRTSPLSFQIVPFMALKASKRSASCGYSSWNPALRWCRAALAGTPKSLDRMEAFLGRQKKTGDVHDALFSLPRWDDARSNDADGRREDFKLGINMRKSWRWRSCVTQSALNLKIVGRMRHDGLWLWRFGSLVWNHTAQFQRFCLLPQSFKPIPRDIEEAYYSLLESRLQSWRYIINLILRCFLDSFTQIPSLHRWHAMWQWLCCWECCPRPIGQSTKHAECRWADAHTSNQAATMLTVKKWICAFGGFPI